MCEPWTIASAVLAIGSTAANSAAQARVVRARNNALRAERIRQAALDQEAAALNTQSQNRYKNFEGQQDQKAEGLAAFYQGQADDTPTAAATGLIPESKSNVVVSEENAQRTKARAETDQQGAALATLRSFGDLLGGIGRDQARDAGQIAQIGGFKTGSTNVLPYELDAAAQKGQGLRTLADAFSGLSAVSGAIGAMRPAPGPLTGAARGMVRGAAPAFGATRAAVPALWRAAPSSGLIRLFGG